jgi:4a-hydroxytetrahydrobiopterin dehydratase
MRWCGSTLDTRRNDMAQLLTDEQIAEHLRGSRWERDGNQIARELKLANFGDAIELVNRVAEVAEARNHHPDILVHDWNGVRLSVTNHSAGGLTDADFQLAAAIDELV